MADHAIGAAAGRARAGRRADPTRLIAAFGNPLQLHHFALAYNINDGFVPAHAIATHPRCDEGTALYLFWQFHDMIGDVPAIAATRSSGLAWNVGALLGVLDARLSARDFASSEIHFDPRTYARLSPQRIETLVAAGVPRERMSAVGHVRVSRML